MSAVRATGLILALLVLALAGCVRPPADHPVFDEDSTTATTSDSDAEEPVAATNEVGEEDAFPLRDIPPAGNAAPELENGELPTDTDITDFDEDVSVADGGESGAQPQPEVTSPSPPMPAADTTGQSVGNSAPADGSAGQANGSAGSSASTAAAAPTVRRSSRPRRSVTAPRRSRSRAQVPPRAAQVRPRRPAAGQDDGLERRAKEIKARRGKQFSDPKWQREFRDKGWYQANPDYSDAHLSPTEREHLKRIRRQQGERGEKAAR